MLKPFFKNIGQQITDMNINASTISKSINDVVQGIDTSLLGSSADDFFKSTPLTKKRYSMPKKFLRYMTGQAGQERVGLQANNVQTISEGFKYLAAQDQVKGQRLKQQSGRIQGRMLVTSGIIGGTYVAVQGARYVSQPRLVNNLEYRNPQYYTQQPVSYRDRLIRMLNNTTL